MLTPFSRRLTRTAGPPEVRDYDRDTRPLRIAQVVETLDTGGAEHLAVKIANALDRRGHKSHILVTSHDGPLSSAIAPGVTTRVFGYRRASIAHPGRFALSIRVGYSQFRRVITADKIDIIQTHLPGPNFWGLAMQVTGVCPSIATIHNNQEFSYGSQRSTRGKLRHAAYRAIITKCAATIAVSDQVKASLLAEVGLTEAHATRLVSIPNGIELPKAHSAETRAATREALGISPNGILCLGVGRVCEQKNFKDLIPVCRLVGQAAGNVRFAVAGDGPDMADLKARIAENGLESSLMTLGNINNVTDVMSAADVFVMPSLWEGLPLALLEAMAAELPVVGNSIDGLRDIIPEGGVGFLVNPGDHAAMADRIVTLAADADLRHRMGAAGLELVRRKYDLTRVIDALEEIYRRIA